MDAPPPQLVPQVNRLRPRREVIRLNLSGPKSLLRNGTAEVEVTSDHTWLQVLSYNLEIDMDANPGIFVTSTRYSPTIAGRGWRFDLNDTVFGLVNKYQRNRKTHCARIHLPPRDPVTRPRTPRRPVTSRSPPVAAAQSPQRRPNLVIPTQGTAISSTSSTAQAATSTSSKSLVPVGTNRPPTPYPSPQDHQFKQPLPPVTRRQSRRRRSGPNVTVKVEPDPIAVPIFHHDLFGESVQEDQGGAKMEVERRPPPNGSDDFDYDNWGEEDEDEDDTLEQEDGDVDDDDDFSVFTAVASEAAELRQQGIRVEEIKSTIEQRFSHRFTNGFMLRVRNELRQLRNNNLWDRNVNRAPLSSYLLTEMFQV